MTWHTVIGRRSADWAVSLTLLTDGQQSQSTGPVSTFPPIRIRHVTGQPPPRQGQFPVIELAVTGLNHVHMDGHVSF